MSQSTPQIDRAPAQRAASNRANAQHSTGPCTPAGKQHSSLNALRHGLTATSPVLPSEDPAAWQDHRSRFFDEYQPATPTESQLVQELADTSWRLNRIPLLEADVLARAAQPVPLDREITFDIVDAHRLLANLGLQSHRLSRQFQKVLDALRTLQADRAERERRNLNDAAALLEHHKHKGIPFHPAQHGFVFSNTPAPAGPFPIGRPQADPLAAPSLTLHIETHAQRLRLLNESRHIEHVLFHMPAPRPVRNFFVAASSPLAP